MEDEGVTYWFALAAVPESWLACCAFWFCGVLSSLAFEMSSASPELLDWSCIDTSPLLATGTVDEFIYGGGANESWPGRPALVGGI